MLPTEPRINWAVTSRRQQHRGGGGQLEGWPIDPWAHLWPGPATKTHHAQHATMHAMMVQWAGVRLKCMQPCAACTLAVGRPYLGGAVVGAHAQLTPWPWPCGPFPPPPTWLLFAPGALYGIGQPNANHIHQVGPAGLAGGVSGGPKTTCGMWVHLGLRAPFWRK